jgi:hypothetical protein
MEDEVFHKLKILDSLMDICSPEVRALSNYNVFLEKKYKNKLQPVIKSLILFYFYETLLGPLNTVLLLLSK